MAGFSGFSAVWQPLTVVRYVWKVANFSASRPFLPETMESPPFPPGQIRQWQMRLWPVADQPDDLVGLVGLKTAELGCDSVLATVQLRFIHDQLCSRSLVAAGFKEKEFRPNRVLWGCQAKAFKTPGDLLIEVEIVTAAQSLADIFIVESSDGQILHVRKDLLVAKEPKFFDLLTQGKVVDGQQDRVKVDFDVDVVRSLLQSVYADNLLDLDAMAIRLLPAAQHYQMDRVVTACAGQLADQLTIANVAETLRIAKLFDLPQLKSACDTFIDQQEPKDLADLIKDELFYKNRLSTVPKIPSLSVPLTPPSLPPEKTEETGWRQVFCGFI